MFIGALWHVKAGLGLASSEPNNEKPSSIIISLLLYVASCHHSAACTGLCSRHVSHVWRCCTIFLHSTWNWDTCLVLLAKIHRSNDLYSNSKWRQITSVFIDIKSVKAIVGTFYKYYQTLANMASMSACGTIQEIIAAVSGKNSELLQLWLWLWTRHKLGVNRKVESTRWLIKDNKYPSNWNSHFVNQNH